MLTLPSIATWLADGVDPVSNLSNYGFAGTIIGIFAVAVGIVWRAQVASWNQQRTDLLSRVTAAELQRDKAVEQRDVLTQTFHDFVLVDRNNTLESLKTSNQIAEDLLSKDEAKERRIQQLEHDLEWERRGRGQH